MRPFIGAKHQTIRVTSLSACPSWPSPTLLRPSKSGADPQNNIVDDKTIVALAIPIATADPIQKVWTLPDVEAAATTADEVKTIDKAVIAACDTQDGSTLAAQQAAATAAVPTSTKGIEN